MTEGFINGHCGGRLGAMQDHGYTPAMTGLETHPSMNSAAVDADWAALEAELDIWQSAGRTASFWWRDDDAIADTPALDRLLALAEDAPIAIAAIPGHAEASLSERLDRVPAATVLQHGWRHANHAQAGERKSELGPRRLLSQRLHDLRLGRERLRSLFGSRSLGVLVPPWNRIAPDLVPRLPEVGIGGLSVAGARPSVAPAAGLRAVNVHADLVDWHGGRGFVGETTALGLVLRHLRGRFLGSVDTEEPTGILTHHLVQDAAAERFLRRLVATVRRHPSARFVPIPELFPST
jgi:hypothetical protein